MESLLFMAMIIFVCQANISNETTTERTSMTTTVHPAPNITLTTENNFVGNSSLNTTTMLPNITTPGGNWTVTMGNFTEEPSHMTTQFDNTTSPSMVVSSVTNQTSTRSTALTTPSSSAISVKTFYKSMIVFSIFITFLVGN